MLDASLGIVCNFSDISSRVVSGEQQALGVEHVLNLPVIGVMRCYKSPKVVIAKIKTASCGILSPDHLVVGSIIKVRGDTIFIVDGDEVRSVVMETRDHT